MKPLHADPTMEAAARMEAREKKCGACSHRGESVLVVDVRLWSCRRGLVWPARGRCARFTLDEG